MGEQIKSLYYVFGLILFNLKFMIKILKSLFEYETKDLNRNVKNNIERFPEYYCFRLTEEEYNSLRCKNLTLNRTGRGQHRKYMPYVFTEYGITMLAGLLKSPIAVSLI